MKVRIAKCLWFLPNSVYVFMTTVQDQCIQILPVWCLRSKNLCFVWNHKYACSTILVCVVYFDQLLGAVSTQKLVKLLFPALFNLFCSFQTFFSDFTDEINKKRLKKNKKMVFVYSSKLVDMQKLVDSLRGYLEIVFFQLIFYFFNIFC